MFVRSEIVIFEPRSVAFERDFAGRQEVVHWTAAFFYFYFTGGKDQKRSEGIASASVRGRTNQQKSQLAG